MSDGTPKRPRTPRGRPGLQPKGFDDVPILSDEEVERRVGVRGGGAPQAPIERAARVPRSPRRRERSTARDSLLLIGLVIAGLVAVRVFLPDGPLTASATSSPGASLVAIDSVGPSPSAAATAALHTVVPVITLPPGSATPVPPTAAPTPEPTAAPPTGTPKPRVTPRPTVKLPTAPPTPPPTAANRATLIVVMHVVNNSGGSTPASAWKVSIGGEAGGAASKNNFAGSETGTTLTIPAGQGYRVADDASQAGYAPRLPSPECTSPTGVGLAAGATVTCTLTRNDRPHVTVVVHVTGGSATANQWAVTVTSANASPKNFQGSEAGVEVIFGFDLSYSIATSGGPSGYAESQDPVCSSTVGRGIDDPPAVCTFTEDPTATAPASTGTVIPLLLVPLRRPRRWRPTTTG